MNLKDKILAAKDTRLEPVDVPEWECTVYVPVMTIAEAEQLQKQVGSDDSFARMACNIIRDEDGNRVFTDADVAELSKKSLAALQHVLAAYNQVNGNVTGSEADPKS